MEKQVETPEQSCTKATSSFVCPYEHTLVLLIFYAQAKLGQTDRPSHREVTLPITPIIIQVFQRAKNKEEYLSYVAKLILHVKQQGRIQQNQQPDDMNQVTCGLMR